MTHSRPVALQRLQGVVTTPSTTGLQHGQPILKHGKDRPEVSKRAGIFEGLDRTLSDCRPRGTLCVGVVVVSKGEQYSQIAGALPLATRETRARSAFFSLQTALDILGVGALTVGIHLCRETLRVPKAASVRVGRKDLLSFRLSRTRQMMSSCIDGEASGFMRRSSDSGSPSSGDLERQAPSRGDVSLAGGQC